LRDAEDDRRKTKYHSAQFEEIRIYFQSKLPKPIRHVVGPKRPIISKTAPNAMAKMPGAIS
jgi:hypothetical protein